MLWPSVHRALASETLGTGGPWRWDEMILWVRSEQAAAETKKAEDASCIALRIPRPPHLTGRVAWVHAGTFSFNLMLAMLLTVDFSNSS